MRIERQREELTTPTFDVDPHERLEELATLRGLSPALLAGYGVHVDDHPTHPIVLPYPNLTGIWYERRRRWMNSNEPPKYLSAKGGSSHLYNPLHLGPGAGQVWLCEGEFDTLAAVSAGLPAIGTQGAGHFDLRWRHLFASATVVVAFDGDDAGRGFGEKIVEAFKSMRTRVMMMPMPDGYDLNDLLKEDRLVEHVSTFADEEGVRVAWMEQDSED